MRPRPDEQQDHAGTIITNVLDSDNSISFSLRVRPRPTFSPQHSWRRWADGHSVPSRVTEKLMGHTSPAATSAGVNEQPGRQQRPRQVRHPSCQSQLPRCRRDSARRQIQIMPSSTV